MGKNTRYFVKIVSSTPYDEARREGYETRFVLTTQPCEQCCDTESTDVMSCTESTDVLISSSGKPPKSSYGKRPPTLEELSHLMQSLFEQKERLARQMKTLGRLIDVMKSTR